MKLQAILLTFLTFLVVAPMALVVNAESNVDSRCTAYLITKPTEDNGQPKCNIVCDKTCIDQGKSCVYKQPTSCIFLSDEQINQGLTGFNIFGVNFGPPAQAIPRIVRMLLTAIFSIVSLVAILIGVYAMYLRSTAGDNAEKAEETIKVIRNAIIGVVICFLGVVIVQIVALLLGISGGLFDFNFIPVKTTLETISQPCSPDGATTFLDEPNATHMYKCVGSRWVRQAGFQ